ncbi:hotdog fold domain-containing protein [Thalassotalea aquiviva]|uniref:hotdog fold domain-containing protein n=1 Tax=Thalassotalea aquiviva TaxID=3242415 RepID=UPI00352B2318
MTQNKLLEIYNKWNKFSFGKRLFSWFFAQMAPYFKTIKPLVQELRPGFCQVLIKKRKIVQNHIGTMHVIAICNGLEMAMGAVAEASIPSHLRWIPKGMSLDYTAKAGTDIRCIADISDQEWVEGDFKVPVKALDENDVVVVQGHIMLWVSKKPEKKA